ncbi:glyoxylase-like metal-dependent hydrolase (beta-lactamase superfamily II) [Brevundimonas alba]|uniref:Glyoxylase-like metal-dependent hydrolase (Beta-lactamase superfamily II) n=1 Tax=Brevundimonas alba TaxID=74314 RepID=A0A7X5YL96_9CAUL|nr:MBL fold metallo-hydrolase [Brevundimonas alba]NJC41702.1 glyoxylase-like metal-dependent hydrolase (beta-lactamase superfamily II) [Brevundimonas alba]
MPYAIIAAALALSFSDPAASAHNAENLQQLAPTAWLLTGRDGNVLIVPEASGVLLVDDERPRDLEEIFAASRSLSPGPVRYVINTHWHLDHSGGNAGLADHGAVIVAHRNVRMRLGTDQFMAAYDRTIPASPEIALPSIVFDHALTLHFGGETIQLRHTPMAHTDGDTLVYLEGANVLHMGDVFFNGLYPFIDRSSGGGIQGLIASVDTGLVMSDGETQIIPAHGPTANRAELQAYRAMLVTVRDKVQAGIDAGRTKGEIIGDRPAATYALEGEEDGFVSAVYDSLLPAQD